MPFFHRSDTSSYTSSPSSSLTGSYTSAKAQFLHSRPRSLPEGSHASRLPCNLHRLRITILLFLILSTLSPQHSLYNYLHIGVVHALFLLISFSTRQQSLEALFVGGFRLCTSSSDVRSRMIYRQRDHVFKFLSWQIRKKILNNKRQKSSTASSLNSIIVSVE